MHYNFNSGNKGTAFHNLEHAFMKSGSKIGVCIFKKQIQACMLKTSESFCMFNLEPAMCSAFGK
jgi:hypothetical protein